MCFENRISYVVVRKIESVMIKDGTLRKYPKMLKKNGEGKNAKRK